MPFPKRSSESLNPLTPTLILAERLVLSSQTFRLNAFTQDVDRNQTSQKQCEVLSKVSPPCQIYIFTQNYFDNRVNPFRERSVYEYRSISPHFHLIARLESLYTPRYLLETRNVIMKALSASRNTDVAPVCANSASS